MSARYPILVFHLVLLVLSPNGLRAQMSDLQFEHLTIEDGLADSEVRCIIQDSRGFMWFGTLAGLNRYDGLRMKTYRRSIDNPESISLSIISSLSEDEHGTVWIAGYTSFINGYDPEKDIFTKYALPNTQQATIQKLHVDRRGNLWVGTWDYGILRFDRQKKQFESFPVPMPEGAEHEMVISFCEDSFNSLWFGVSNGLYCFSWADSSFQFYPLPGGIERSKDGFINVIFEDSHKDLWVGTRTGALFLFQRGNNTFLPLASDFRFSSPGILAITEDLNDRLWIATGSGLMLHDRMTKSFHSHRGASEGRRMPEEDHIWSAIRDRQGNIWLGTFASGVSLWSRHRKQFSSYQNGAQSGNSIRLFYERADSRLWISQGGNVRLFDPDKHRFEAISYPIAAWSVFEDEKGWMWMGTWDGLHKFHPVQDKTFFYQTDPAQKGRLPARSTPYIFQDRQGGIWISVRGIDLYRYDPVHDSFSPFLKELVQTTIPVPSLSNVFYEDRRGNLWLSEGGHLFKINPDRNNYTIYSLPNLLQSALLVHTMTEDRSGALWLGTHEGGLVHFNPATNEARFWTLEDGLPSNTVLGILEDEPGNLWISTNRGLSRFDPKTGRFKNYDQADGLPSTQLNQKAYLKTRNGEMYFGTTNGFVRFFPDSIRDNPLAPDILITEIRINNQSVPIAGTLADARDRPSPLKAQAPYVREIILSYWQKDLAFEFTALNYFHSEKNRFRYRLENYDEYWLSTDASRPFAGYTNLNPGTYTFRVLGSNNDGVWNEEEASLFIQILPP